MSATTGDQARPKPPEEERQTSATATTATTAAPPTERPATQAKPQAAAAPTRPPRVYRGELTSALCALGLLALMFLAKWYGTAGVPDPSAARPAISSAEDAWSGLTIVRWIMLLTIAAALGSVVLHASQRSHGTRTDTSRVVFGLGALTSLLLLYRVLIELPQASRVIDQKLGAVLGLACAMGIAVGGFESMHEQRTLSKAIARNPRHRQRTKGDDASVARPAPPAASE